MVFSSLTFLLLFLPITICLYYITDNVRVKNIILLAASLVFYAWGEPVYIVLIVLSVLFNYYVGCDLHEMSKSGKGNRKLALIIALAVNIALLGYFKYSGFLIDSINGITGLSIPYRELALPIGISFYTFQAVSYIIDVYRGREAESKLLNFAVYITMFPQLIAGPIVRLDDIAAKLEDRKYSPTEFREGFLIFAKGLAKKIIIADTLGQFHDSIMLAGPSSAGMAWLGAIAYTLQIFNDFSGYSDMAIGLGKMLGFSFPMNFDRPYISTSITEFWRRWHMTLSSWFKEYIYIPLGGNRKGVKRQIINLLIVWSLTGLWHGASWNFVAWGLYYGLLLIFEKFIYSKTQKKLPIGVNWIITQIVVVFGWVIFFSPSLGSALSYIGYMFGINVPFWDANVWFNIMSNLFIFALGMLMAVIPNGVVKKLSPLMKWILSFGLVILSIFFLVSGTYNAFLYFRF